MERIIMSINKLVVHVQLKLERRINELTRVDVGTIGKWTVAGLGLFNFQSLTPTPRNQILNSLEYLQLLGRQNLKVKDTFDD